MSPLSIRRYRAERLLRAEFETLRGRVLSAVRGRLAASGVVLDPADLEACYSQAWQGLYMAILEGQEIANPTGWLVLACFRRAIEEHRARRRGAEPRKLCADGLDAGSVELDLAAELDDRIRLRQLFEGLRARLGDREREAAVLCYLQGLSRAEAAARMGISESRMGKLMDGRGAGRPGVAAKVGALVETIREGGWCEEQESLMRALAFGLLDPQGERHRLALMHSGECPACRAYVSSLRGLAAAFPPVFLPFGVGAGVLAHAGGAAHVGSAAASSAGAAASKLGTGAAAGAGRSLGGALGAPAAGGFGGGWLLSGGPLGAKLAVGCLLALGVGASCAELGVGGHAQRPHRAQHRRGALAAVRRVPVARAQALYSGAVVQRAVVPAAPARPAQSVVAPAAREFGPERGPGAGASPLPAASGPTASAAHAAAVNAPGGESAAVPVGPGAATGASLAGTVSASKAAREFSPG